MRACVLEEISVPQAVFAPLLDPPLQLLPSRKVRKRLFGLLVGISTKRWRYGVPGRVFLVPARLIVALHGWLRKRDYVLRPLGMNK